MSKKYIATVVGEGDEMHQLVYRENNGVPIPESFETVLARATELADDFPDSTYHIWKLEKVIGPVYAVKYNIAFLEFPNLLRLVFDLNGHTIFKASKEEAEERIKYLKQHHPRTNYFIIEAVNGN